MKLPWTKKKDDYVADPTVEVVSNTSVTAGIIKIRVGTQTILLSEAQAKNLWGELGGQLRKIAARPSGMSVEDENGKS